MTSPISRKELQLLALGAVAAAYISKREKKRKKRTKWCKEWLLKRENKILSHLTTPTSELHCDNEDWFIGLRMDEQCYRKLLLLVTPLIKKRNTLMRAAISPHERLAATLKFIATGCSYESLKYSMRISAQSLGHIIPETCDAIIRALQDEYMKFPRRPAEWRKESQEFADLWKFPNVLGVVTGKHVLIVPPNNSSPLFQNYKGSHSFILMAVVNAKGEFLKCDLGVNGQNTDSEVLERTLFYEYLCENRLNLPELKPDETLVVLPYVFVGDEAFTAQRNLLTAYSQKEMTNERMMFNYQLSCILQVAENTFKILAARFRIFTSPINMKVENIKIVVMACCFLHNFLLKTRRDSYSTMEDVMESCVKSEQPTSPFLKLQPCRDGHAGEKGLAVREHFRQYCNLVGKSF